MKYILAIFLCITLIVNVFSQEKPAEWTLYSEVNGVQFYYKYAECHNLKTDKHWEYVLLQIINTSSETMEVQWKRESWYGDKCTNCDSDSEEHIHKRIFEPGQTITGECDSKERELKILSKFLNFRGPELSKFNIAQIEVTPQ